MKKESLLTVLSSLNPDKSIDENYALIICGSVLVNGEKIREPSRKIDINSDIAISEKKYVSRGGFKLDHALSYWNINVKGRICLDAGASTGGFTDCLLQHGAEAVHAVDVGYNQLDYSLRINPRVIVHEKTNIMNLKKLTPVPDIGVADLSFRSIISASSRILDIVSEKKLIALVKPQFEVKDRSRLIKGVIRDKKSVRYTLFQVISELFREKSFVSDLTRSPIPGRKGNEEYLFYITSEKSMEIESLMKKIDKYYGFD